MITDWLSVLPPEISLQCLVLLVHPRWVIEHMEEDGTQECGLDHSQGRRWQELHRHLALVMLAFSFLLSPCLALPLPAGEAFPLSLTQSSMHQQVLLWLFQDLVPWLLHMQQIRAFLPRRTNRGV
jgi:hypothetical protein